jgi:hypothetical protein
MTNLQRSGLNLVNTWLQPAADAYRASKSCFQQLPADQPPQPEPFQRLNASGTRCTGLKAGANEIQGFARKGGS